MSPAEPKGSPHLLSFDIEHWYEGYRHRGAKGWESLGPRDPRIVEQILRVLASAGQTATFFCTGRFCREFPAVVRTITDARHELASHSFEHRLVTAFKTPGEFRDDLRQSIRILEDTSGTKVLGYRAPKWSLPSPRMPFYEILQAEGLAYDSSLFPASRSPARECAPFVLKVAGQPFWEFPATTLQVGPVRLPAAGGLWLRLFPGGFSRRALWQKTVQGVPGMVYLHPYDLDPGCPRLPGLGWKGLPFYFARNYSLHNTEAKLTALLGANRFTSIRDWLAVRQTPAAA